MAIKYLLTLRLENEAEVLEKIFAKLDVEGIKEQQSQFTNQIVYEILNKKYPEQNWAETYSKSFKNQLESEKPQEFGGVNLNLVGTNF